MRTSQQQAVFTHTPATRWAATAWTPERLAARLTVPLAGVKVIRRDAEACSGPEHSGDGAVRFHYSHAAPMAAVPALVAATTAAAYNRTSMTASEFFAASAG